MNIKVDESNTGNKYPSTMKMLAVCSSAMLAHNYKTCKHNPEDYH
jgi:hypothetical protein